ncbi:hypothetical protein [Methanospirillum sp.]|uniref:hypothetical protein n=1 Tax=Methanospirillum sp. TaxID=45200 RepID=UPI002985CE62|nr:hypothetical protein [Methanospirillum sp.]
MTKISLVLLLLLFTGFILCAGCSSYATPELTIVPTITQVNAIPETNTITYDVNLMIENTGSNNAYNVEVMALVSTPKDLPEYRFTHENIQVGTVEKRTSTSVKRQLSLEMTPDNYQKLTSGARQAEVEAKVIKISSNVMG